MQSQSELLPGCVRISQNGRNQTFFPSFQEVCTIIDASANFSLEYALLSTEKLYIYSINIPQFAQHTLLCTMKQIIYENFGFEITSEPESYQWFETIQFAKRPKTINIENSKVALNLRFAGACKSSTLLLRENGNEIKIQFSIPAKYQDESRKRKHSETQLYQQNLFSPEPNELVIGRTHRSELQPGDYVKFYRLDDKSKDVFRINSVGKPKIEDGSEVWLLNINSMVVITGTIRNHFIEANETIRVGDIIEITLPNKKTISGKFEFYNIKPTEITTPNLFSLDENFVSNL